MRVLFISAANDFCNSNLGAGSETDPMGGGKRGRLMIRQTIVHLPAHCGGTLRV